MKGVIRKNKTTSAVKWTGYLKRCRDRGKERCRGEEAWPLPFLSFIISPIQTVKVRWAERCRDTPLPSSTHQSVWTQLKLLRHNSRPIHCLRRTEGRVTMVTPVPGHWPDAWLKDKDLFPFYLGKGGQGVGGDYTQPVTFHLLMTEITDMQTFNIWMQKVIRVEFLCKIYLTTENVIFFLLSSFFFIMHKLKWKNVKFSKAFQWK